MTTLRDISRHLGLSVTQVSRALNNHEDVSEETRKRVQEAAKKLNYQPNMMARRLVTGRSGIVGFVQPRMPGPEESVFFMHFLAGLSAGFSQHGRQFVLHMADREDDPLDVYARLVGTRSIDGFVITEPVMNDPRIAYLRENNVPFVLHGQTMDQPDFPFFDIDNVAVGYDLTKHLIDHGHRDIAFINGIEGSSYVHRREVGYRRALEEAGLPYRKPFDLRGPMSENTGLLETVRMFQSEGPKPTAIVAGNMRIAKGIFTALDAVGLSVPNDISLVAHDDLLPDVMPHKLPVAVSGTTSPIAESWGPLADHLSRFLDGAPLKDVQKIAPHTFIKRGSVRPA